MLNLQEIISTYPNILQAEKRQILREYLQYKILNYIFNRKHSNKLCFIGWTCLRLIYWNKRFSEDLDFDNKNLSYEEFSQIWTYIQNMLELEWLEVEIKLIQKQAFHCAIKIPKILFENNLAGMSTEKITIKIDTFDQWVDYDVEVTKIDKFDTIWLIRKASVSVLLAQKIYTAFDRERTKWRDFFDIVFLLAQTKKPDYNFLKVKIGIDNPIDLKKHIRESCKRLDFKLLYQDVQKFLFNPHDQSVLLFPEIIKQIEFEK